MRFQFHDALLPSCFPVGVEQLYGAEHIKLPGHEELDSHVPRQRGNIVLNRPLVDLFEKLLGGLLLLRGQLRRHVGLGRGRGLHPAAAAARPTERARERGEPGAAGRRFRVSVPQQPEAGSRMVGPAGAGRPRRPRTPLLSPAGKALTTVALFGAEILFYFLLSFPRTPPPLPEKKKGAGEDLIANRDLKRK